MILTIMFQDVSRQTVLQFLKILYTGFAEGLKVGDFDSVHKLCELLGVSLNDSSVSFDSKSKNKGLKNFKTSNSLNKKKWFL